MPKKRLDATTLEAIAELICGSGEGGRNYASPGPYRMKPEIQAFFERAGVHAGGQSSTRKWFVLESLHILNMQDKGNLVPSSLERVLLRLATPKEYRGDSQTTQKVLDHLNQLLQVEGLEIVLLGIDPQLREKAPGTSVPKAEKKTPEAVPDFRRFVRDAALAEILKFRWEEAQKCMDGGAYLASVVMMGSILEGALLYKVEEDPGRARAASKAPKDKSGNVRPIHEWVLSALIEVAHEVGWLQGDVKRFSHGVRESRNIVHPYVQRNLSETPDSDTCSICWQVVRAAVADLLGID